MEGCVGSGGADTEALVGGVCRNVVKGIKRGSIGVVGETVGGA